MASGGLTVPPVPTGRLARGASHALTEVIREQEKMSEPGEGLVTRKENFFLVRIIKHLQLVTQGGFGV